MDSTTQLITIKLNVTKKDSNDGVKNIDRVIHVNKNDFMKINSESSLIDYLNGKNLNLLISKDVENVEITRKSKKHKCFIPLSSEEDFKSLHRSLKVKNHVKLSIKDKTPVSREDKKSNEFNFDLSADLAKLGDALLETTLEHLKEFFSNNKINLNKNYGFGSSFGNAPPTTTTTSSSTEESTAEKATSAKEEEEEETQEEQPIHSRICCDKCNPIEFIPIKGVRYACLICKDYDLCSKCESKQQSYKLDYGAHSYLHPMVKITTPSVLQSNLQSEFKNNHYFPNHEFFSTSRQNNDIIYDVPLADCSLKNREKLENLLVTRGLNDFVNNVDTFIDKSDKYNALLDLVDKKDDDEKISYIKELLAKASTDDNVSENATLINVSSSGHSNDKLIVQLVNKSPFSIEEADLKLKLDNENGVYGFNKTNCDIKQDQIRNYTATKIDQQEDEDVDSFDQSVCDMEIDETSSGLTFKEIKEIKENKEKPLTLVTEESKVKYTMKSDNLMQIEIFNNSKNIIDCDGLNILVFNKDETLISEVNIKKNQGIKIGNSNKFNLTLNLNHNQNDDKKIPYKIIINNDEFSSIGYFISNDSTIAILKELIDDEVDLLQNLQDSTTSTTTDNYQTSSEHSIVLPKVITNSKLIEIDETTKLLNSKSNNSSNKDDDDDFEMMNYEKDQEEKNLIDDDDYEILSAVSTDAEDD